jgi:hypothetical protein
MRQGDYADAAIAIRGRKTVLDCLPEDWPIG